MKKTNRTFIHPRHGTIALSDHVIRRVMQRFEFGEDSYNFTVHFIKNALLNASEVKSWKDRMGRWMMSGSKTRYFTFGDSWLMPLARTGDSYVAVTIYKVKDITLKKELTTVAA